MKLLNATTYWASGRTVCQWLRPGLLAGLICFISLVGYPLIAEAAESLPASELPSVLVRTSLNPENPVVGQQVELRIDVLVNSWFAKAPEFPDLQIAEAIALLPPSASINLTERLGGQSYAGQRRTYFLLPQLPGRYNVPALSVTVTPAQPGNPRPEPITRFTEPVDFLAVLPPALATQTDHPLLATSDLRVKTHLATAGDPNAAQLKTLHTGDTLELTVTLTAVDTLASVLPAIAVPTISGLSAYPAPPKLTNQFKRGRFTARRIDRISYIAEEPGRYQLPEQTIVWWNTQTQSLQTEVIPAIDLRVQSTPAQFLQQLLPWLLGLLVIIGGGWYYWRSLLAIWQNLLQRFLASELVRWWRLRRACRNHDPQTTWSNLATWLESFPTPTGMTPLKALVNQADYADLVPALHELEAVLFRDRQNDELPLQWTGHALLRALTQIRRHQWDKPQWHRQTTADLPPLNPPV